MNPITPQRFNKLLSESETDDIELWNSSKSWWGRYKGSYKSLGIIYLKSICSHNSAGHNIIYCYESQPETPLDELDGIISKWGCTSEDWKYFDLITDWRKKYNSQLKEMK